eukprot:6190323-Pleurochrysis_carterae.AAC.2
MAKQPAILPELIDQSEPEQFQADERGGSVSIAHQTRRRFKLCAELSPLVKYRPCQMSASHAERPNLAFRRAPKPRARSVTPTLHARDTHISDEAERISARARHESD